MKKISRIYVRLPNWIGDVCMSLPSLHALINTGCELVICAKPWAQDLLQGLPKMDFIGFSGRWREDRQLVKKHLKAHPPQGQAVGLLLPDSLTSALSFRLAGLPCAGYRDDGRSLLLKWPYHKPQPRPHAVESWYHLTRRALVDWGFDCPEKPASSLSLPLTEQHQVQAQAIVDSFNNKPFILIAPTATGKHLGREKIWPHFNLLTRTLQEKGHLVVMAPPPGEKDMALLNAPTATLLAPMSLGTFVALLSHAQIVLCNDSGVSHLAAVSAPAQITLIGVTSPERTGPWSNRAIVAGKMDHWPSFDEVFAMVESHIKKIASNESVALNENLTPKENIAPKA